jgi:putative FmdB family regulatory protein
MEEPVPTYQYACTACHHQLEAVQSFTDDPLTQCPVCDGQLRKLFGSVGIVFKGPGFYRTDSRSTANGASNGDGGKPGANGSGGDSTAGKDKQKDGGASKEKPAATAATTAST